MQKRVTLSALLGLVILSLTSGCVEKSGVIEAIEDHDPDVAPIPNPDPYPVPESSVPPTPTPTPTADPVIPESEFSQIYEVGPGKQFADPSAVPWESLQPGTLVKIHYRAQPYADKWVIAARGTAAEPVVIRGIPDSAGTRPVITGNGAKTRLQLEYWNEIRSVIKVGGSSIPAGTPSYVTIENLDIRSAHPSYSFTDDAGARQTYSENAASIHIEAGSHITVRNCIIHDSANGLFAGSAASDVLIEGNFVHGNGVVGSIYQHNSYTETLRITFQYNHYAPLRAGAPGNSLKDRSAGTVIRYNWMDGGNRPIDLVESDSTTLLNDPAYSNTYVYGNILIKNDVSENGQVIHYGGDSGATARYRKGTLWFFNNTVVSYRSSNTTLFGISTVDETVQAFNNIVHATAGGARLAMSDASGTFYFHHNWMTTGWRQSFSGFTGGVTSSDVLTGTQPGLTNISARDYTLLPTSPAIGAGIAVPTPPGVTYPLTEQYAPERSHGPRSPDSASDLGAFTASR